MRKPAAVKFFSALVHLATGLAVVTVVLVSQHWFGKGDVPSFAALTVPLAAGLALGGAAVLQLLPGAGFGRRALVAVVAGGLVAVGWAFCMRVMFGPWLGAFSFPVLYPWLLGSVAQLLFLARFLPDAAAARPLAGRIGRLGLLPLGVLAGIVVITGLGGAKDYFMRPTKKLFLVPEGFSGPVRVAYGLASGIEPALENGRQVLPIPANGVLVIRPEYRAGMMDERYYFVAPNGQRRKIPVVYFYDDRKPGTAGIFFASTTKGGGQLPGGGWSSEAPGAYDCTDYIVFDPSTPVFTSEQRTAQQRAFDSLAEAVVQQRRAVVEGAAR